jgi:predicted CXXCH cytochrome family protein
MRLPVSMAPAILFIILLFLPAQTRSSEPLLPAERDPHDFLLRYNMGCKDCHASVGIKSRGVMRKSVEEICTGCHKLPGHSHPVDIQPAFVVPADLPLDMRGMLTCATCHDPHRSYMNPASGERTMYLRRDGTRQQFCESCHHHAK